MFIGIGGGDEDVVIGLIKYESVSCSVASDSVTPWTLSQQTPLSLEFSRQEYWSMLPFPFPEDLPDPGTEPTFPALQVDSLLWEILSIEINK